MHLTEIFIYPIKSCRGLRVDVTRLDRFGPRWDRRWMVVTPEGEMLTQREFSGLALIEVALLEQGLRMAFSGSRFDVAYPTETDHQLTVRVWDDLVTAIDAGDGPANWLSDVLKKRCRLVFMPESCFRRVDGAYASAGESVGFADGFPLLLISQPSLDNLNERLDVAVPMNRFRPNLVVSGCDPFAEDDWQRIRIGALEFDVAKACSRCVMPSIIQETAERDPQINRVLAGFRRFQGQILFGQNLLYQREGEISVGDSVEVLA